MSSRFGKGDLPLGSSFSPIQDYRSLSLSLTRLIAVPYNLFQFLFWAMILYLAQGTCSEALAILKIAQK